MRKLNEALFERQVNDAISLLKNVGADRLKFVSAERHLGHFLLCLSHCVDLGYQSIGSVQHLLNQISPRIRSSMVLRDFLMVRMAEAFVALAHEDSDEAIELLSFVLRAKRELGSEELTALAHFWKGRAHRKKGEYEKAYEDILSAREMAERLQLQKFAAAIQVQEAWCVFQRGEPKEAWALLERAERELRTTDDDLSLGNIHSARGRIVRRTGEYADSLAHYQRAIEVFRRGHPDHRSLARTLVNAAYVKRLLALYLRKRLDERSERRGRAHGAAASRRAGSVSATSGGATESLQARYLNICHEALADLENAGRIYALYQHHGGAGAVLVNGGYVHLDLGDIERAAAEGANAYELACSKHDHILMARARVLQGYAEIARVEEELGEDADISVYAHQARRYAEEAVQLAQRTQNRRLLAGALIVCGVVAASNFFEEWEEAHRYEVEARALLRVDDRDHLGEELASLKSKIVRSIGIDETLRAWSQGIVGQKTFQQITEEFAEVVIPQVWLREGKKVSRVAERLSVSPKKVRRILRNAGLLLETGSGA